MIIYLACPIDADEGRSTQWKRKAQAVLRAENAVVFTPADAWCVPRTARPTPELQAANQAMLGRADGVLVAWPAGVPSIGVPMEALMALQAQRRVAWVTDHTSSWVLPWLSATFPYHLATFTFDQMEEAARWLLK